jgi:hypothetical protein
MHLEQIVISTKSIVKEKTTSKDRQPATKSFLLSKGDCFTGKTIF